MLRTTAVGLALNMLLGLAVVARAADLELVSVPDDPFVLGNQGDKSASRCRLGGEYAVFSSPSTQLVADDTNGQDDVFVKHLPTGALERISFRADGSESSVGSIGPQISSGGRYVAFQSTDDLFGSDSNGSFQIYLHDRATGGLTLVTRGIGGGGANGSSISPRFDPSENYLVFESNASDLVAGDGNGVKDIFLYEIPTQTIEIVSVDSAGVQGDQHSFNADVSVNGDLIAFVSSATNLVANDSNDLQDFFVRDRVAGTTTRVNVDAGGNEANDFGFSVRLSSDGSRVFYDSSADNLVPGDSNGASDVFMTDPLGGSPSLVSVDQTGAQGNADSMFPQVGANGSVVAFVSEATNLSAINPGGEPQVFVKFMADGRVEQRTPENSGLLGVSDIGREGGPICFAAAGTELVDDDTNQVTDAYIVRTQSGVIRRISTSSSLHPMLAGNGSSTLPHINGDGTRVVFLSRALALDGEALDGSNAFRHVYLRDRDSGDNMRISNSAFSSDPANADSYRPRVSSDGRFVAYQSSATNLVLGVGEDRAVYRADAQNGATALVSANMTGGAVSATGSIDVSATGEFVAFASNADNLTADDTNGEVDIFIWSAGNAIERVSVRTDGGESNNDSSEPALSADARFIAFHSTATNLVDDDTNFSHDVFVHDRDTGSVERVSVQATGEEASGISWYPDISADGRYVTFESRADNLVPDDIDVGADIFWVDRDTNEIVRATEGLSALGLLAPWLPSMSADGESIVFYAADVAGTAHLVRYSRSTRSLQVLVDGDPNGKTERATPQGWAVSDNGRQIVVDWIDRLLPEDTNDPDTDSDVYAVTLQFGELGFDRIDDLAAEGIGTVQVAVRRINGVDGNVQIDYRTEAGTALETEDFEPVAGRLEWPDGDDTARVISVPIADDAAPEDSESFTIRLTDPRGGAALANSLVEIIIVDDDEEVGATIFADGFEVSGN